MLAGLAVILTALVPLAGEAHRPSRSSSDRAAVQSGPPVIVIVPGVARAESDTLDLQLD